MMNLFSVLAAKFRGNDQEFRILVLGLDNAGKTTILKKMAGEEILHIMPTQGFNIKSINKCGFKLNLWDIGGQRAIRSYWRNYYKDTDGLVYVIDSTDRNRIEETGVELATMLEDTYLRNVPLLVMANKQDLATALNPDNIVNELKLTTIRDRPWWIYGVSAKNGTGIAEAMEWLTKKIKQKKNTH